MALLFSMLPIYLLGNFHCMGMCGPLVMMLGKSPYRYLYFLGRTLSFTLAGTIAGTFGAVLNVILSELRFGILASLLFGILMILCGFLSFFRLDYPGHSFLAKKLAPFNQTLSLTLLKQTPLSTFLFGFFTILLPCGQTLIVYSACALSGDCFSGSLNGLVFAILTAPALFLAMQAEKGFKFAKKYYHELIGIAAMFVGMLALLRGFAEMGLIPHFTINETYHVMIF